MTRTTFALKVPPPFELKLVLFGHGWIDLAPNEWEGKAATWATALAIGRHAVDLRVRQARPDALQVVVARGGGRCSSVGLARAARAALTRMLALDHDLGGFWQLCAADPARAWVARRGAGRLLRAPTLFEDLLKLLFTTNCSWAATRKMVERLCTALGPVAPSGRRAFPDPRACAGADEAFWRETVRAGYRADAAGRLARGFVDGALRDAAFDDARVPTDELRRRLLALHGIGPYAAGQALRLLGRGDDLALDSWCRGQLSERWGRRRPPSDRAVERAYARFGAHRGRILWMDLTAAWHGEGPLLRRDRVVRALGAGS